MRKIRVFYASVNGTIVCKMSQIMETIQSNQMSSDLIINCNIINCTFSMFREDFLHNGIREEGKISVKTDDDSYMLLTRNLTCMPII